MSARLTSMNEFFALIKFEINQSKPYLLSTFETYAAEASFARGLLDEDLEPLNKDASILEVGAGALLLSCQLVREGYEVTALEPIGCGFGHFSELQELVLNLAKQQDCVPQIMTQKVEEIVCREAFDFVFSINVMEHVDDVPQAILAVTGALKMGAYYRFICPNYLFPYEPHFNIPTLFSKRLTHKIFHNAIYNNKAVGDPDGMWRSLNWITILSVKRQSNSMPNVELGFKKDLFFKMIGRVINDDKFSSRRSVWMRKLFHFINLLKLSHVAKYIPVLLQPVIDCKITKIEAR